MVKSIAFFAFLSALFPASVQAQTFTTRCNLRYNNLGVIHGALPCQATFSRGRLHRVAFDYPGGRRYDWTVGQPGITGDPRWSECLRHTAATGNQWQACTVPSPTELGAK